MKREILVETFTPMYDSFEDRIKLIINYQNIEKRVDLMLTRSFIINFIPAFDDYLLEYYNEDKTENAVEEETITQVSHNNGNEKNQEEKKSSITQTDQTNIKLLEKEPELLTKIDFLFDKKTKQTTLLFTTKKTIVKTTLSKKMLEQLIQTIRIAIPNFSWGIAPNF